MRHSDQRDIVYQVVSSSCDHPNVDTILARCKEHMPSINMATVYRNLNSLVDEGLVRRITLAGTPDRFDKTKCDHDHLVCQKCGKLKDVYLSGIADEIKNNSGDEIISYELNAYYICDSCK